MVTNFIRVKDQHEVDTKIIIGAIHAMGGNSQIKWTKFKK